MAITEFGAEELTAGQQIVFANTANNVSGVLAVACGASDTTITLSPGGGALFPTAPFYCSIEFEVVWCLSKSGDSLIVQRGFDGTTATSHAIGVSVEMRNNAGLWTDAYNGINSVSTDVGNLATGILNKTALPPDTVFVDATQELTHKTIDLTDASKQNVIIGNVSPDPAQLTYTNILDNGGFDLWTTNPSTTLAAGTPTSGSRNALAINFWQVWGVNDSAITVARDTSNPDGVNPAGYDALINISTVQANDSVFLVQSIDSSAVANINALTGMPCSLSARIKIVSGTSMTVQFALNYTDSSGAEHGNASPRMNLAGTGYQTYKFENQIWANGTNPRAIRCYIMFQGVGQVAVDNVMAIQSSVAGTFRPKLLAPPDQANQFVNGGFEIWQRGTIFNTAGMSADRWSLIGTGSCQQSASTDGAYASGLCMWCDITSAFPGGIYQHLAAHDYSQLAGRTISVSVRVQSSVANQVRIEIYDGVNASTSDYSASNSQWSTISLTHLVSENSNGIDIHIRSYAAGIFYVDSAMLVFGSIPAAYIPLPPADDLARCQRYYRRFFASSAISLGIGMNYGQANSSFDVLLSPRMAVSPALTISNPGDWSVAQLDGSLIQCTNLLLNISHPDVMQLITQIGSNVLTSGAATWLQNTNGNAWIAFEANP